jgi:hypothetical protein
MVNSDFPSAVRNYDIGVPTLIQRAVGAHREADGQPSL